MTGASSGPRPVVLYLYRDYISRQFLLCGLCTSATSRHLHHASRLYRSARACIGCPAKTPKESQNCSQP